MAAQVAQRMPWTCRVFSWQVLLASAPAALLLVHVGRSNYTSRKWRRQERMRQQKNWQFVDGILMGRRPESWHVGSFCPTDSEACTAQSMRNILLRLPAHSTYLQRARLGGPTKAFLTIPASRWGHSHPLHMLIAPRFNNSSWFVNRESRLLFLANCEVGSSGRAPCSAPKLRSTWKEGIKRSGHEQNTFAQNTPSISVQFHGFDMYTENILYW